MNQLRRRNIVVFVALTYIVFWCLLGLTGIVIWLKVPPYVTTIAKNICAWTPTFVLLAMFRRLFPGISFRQYVKQNFSSHVNPLTLLLLLALQAAVAALALFAQLWTSVGAPIQVSLMSPPALLTAFVVTATAGPMGEELGWRAYLLKELQTRHSLFVSGLIVGVLWGVWHLPLWIISGYAGIRLAFYAAYFLVSIVSTSLIITVFYSRSWNLLIPMWIHFLFNLALALVKADLLGFFGWTSLGYVVLTLILIVIERKRMFEKKKVCGEDGALKQTMAT